MADSPVQLKVHRVACGTGENVPGVQLISAPGLSGSGPDGELFLSMAVGPGDAHSLCHELSGDATVRGDSLKVAKRLVELLGGSIIAARLTAAETFTASLDVQVENVVVSLDVEPALAVAVTTCLAVPLFADESVIEMALAAQQALELSPTIAEFLQSLDFGQLGPDDSPPQDHGAHA